MKCPFCPKDKALKHKIFETASEYVIYNIRPGENRGKCTVVPKRHVTKIRDLTDEETASLFKIVRLVSIVYSEKLKPPPIGFNYGLNEGSIAGQTLEHLHFHIIPRYQDDGLSDIHLFHRDPQAKAKLNLSDEELRPIVNEFKKLFQK